MKELHERCDASRWGLSPEQFCASLERSAAKCFGSESGTPAEIERYLSGLHLEDLALATACAAGYEPAWEHFVVAYRPYLRASAGAILRCPSTSPAACELADSLFTDLYGIAEARGGERSLFRYFHGRSSLKTWLRAVLAQRHIDAIRASRRFEELPEEENAEASRPLPPPGSGSPGDPHRERYVSLFARALQAALAALAPPEKDRLRLYYAEEKTLAEIGSLLGEHESSVSRHLGRVRRELRVAVEEHLRRGFAAVNGSAAEAGLSDAEIAVCLEYSAENTPLDLDKLLPRPTSEQSPGQAAGKRVR